MSLRDSWPAEFRITVGGSGTHELRLVGATSGLNSVDCRCGVHLGRVPTSAGADPVLLLWHTHQDAVLRQQVGA